MKQFMIALALLLSTTVAQAQLYGSCQSFSNDVSNAATAIQNEQYGIDYISFSRSSSWLEGAVFVPSMHLQYHTSMVIVITKEGGFYAFPNVPQYTFSSWEFAISPGSYYHSFIKKYRSNCM